MINDAVLDKLINTDRRPETGERDTAHDSFNMHLPRPHCE
jgi:hypothetical protein